jgi:hypothetical protein
MLAIVLLLRLWRRGFARTKDFLAVFSCRSFVFSMAIISISWIKPKTNGQRPTTKDVLAVFSYWSFVFSLIFISFTWIKPKTNYQRPKTISSAESFSSVEHSAPLVQRLCADEKINAYLYK